MATRTAPAKKAPASKTPPAPAKKAPVARKSTDKPAAKPDLPTSAAAEKPKLGPPPKGVKAPKTPSVGVDLYKALEKEYRDAKAVSDAAEERLKWVKAWLIDNIPKTGGAGAVGKTGFMATTIKKSSPRAENWSAIYRGIVAEYAQHVKKKTGQEDAAFALLQKRLADGAVADLWEAGRRVDGISKFEYTTLSVTKV